jgi:hypothetical protein
VEAIPLTPGDEDRRVDTPITVAGVELSPGTVARLALELHRAGEFALSIYIGRAVDQARAEIPLERVDRGPILRVIVDDPTGRFEGLRRALSELEGVEPDTEPEWPPSA